MTSLFHRLAFVVALLSIGCSQPAKPPGAITLATTTSTRDSGLLDVLLPMFERESGVAVKVVAVGSGQALELGRRGDADVLLTHSPKAEEEFMADGHGDSRQPVMHNDFVIVGPASDPAAIQGADSAIEAFRRIAVTESKFVSRGDESGTHAKELSIWKAAETSPHRGWYLRAGSGMAATLRIANEKNAYTLSDRGTFLAQSKQLDLVILSEGDSLLRNPYAVIVVSTAKHAHINQAAAKLFAGFLLSPTTQIAIAKFGIDRYGQPLFFPNPTP
ncbi:MAG: substrate-binding domain-containing protein [Planctomycetia bacterium]|nr:substrate-binding domain-containing protein [Planctomycetia bacterium]